MIRANEDALICDFAETYGVLDYRAHGARLAGTLASGLRSDARIFRFLEHSANGDTRGFSSGDAFEAARKRILNAG